MGIVYEAEQLSLDRRVALKVLPFATVLDPRQLLRFKNEARAAATLDHPQIVHVYSVGQERGVHFYAMQLIESHSLAEVLNELRTGDSSSRRNPEGSVLPPTPGALPSGPRPNDATTAPGNRLSTAWSELGREYFRQVARWGIQAAEALHYAHQLGIVHRDIKPSNLLVNAEGQVWVTDFGLAMTRAEADLTLTGELVGTLRYMSPKQALGQRGVVDQRTDVYSLGLTLYEFLALRPAFPEQNRAELLRQLERDDPPRLRGEHHLGEPVPKELETIVFKAIDKDPAARYLTAQQLADDLERFLNDQPIRARTPTWCDQAIKWSRRNRGPLAAALIVMTVLLAGIVGTTWGLVRSERARLAEVHHRQLAQDSERKALAAAAAEKQAKEQAKAREAETEAVLRFIQDKIFAAARPKGQDGGLGVNVTLQEALRSALPFLNRQLANQPLTEARLRKSMGISFWEIGDFPGAATQFEKASSLYAQHLGDRHGETLDTESWLTLSYNALGRHSEAAQFCEQRLALARTALGPHARQTGSFRHHLADAYRGLGRAAEALPLNKENLVMKRIQYGPESSEVKEYLAFLGLCYVALGSHAEAIEVFEQALAARRDRHGSNHFHTIDCMNWLSDSYSAVGRVEVAIPLREEVLTTTKIMYGAP
jgi:serine/threonine protein kinase/tetratricopeptide (TPR) repeat protein